MSEERELGWDEEVGPGEGGFTILPAGKVRFTVQDVEKQRSKGSASIAPCNMAKVKLKLETQEGLVGGCFDFLLLHTKMQWKLNQFFIGLGFDKNADGTVKMAWNNIIGKSGFCEVKIDTYDGKESNKIEKYLEPQTVESPSQIAPPTYQEPQPQTAPPAQGNGGW